MFHVCHGCRRTVQRLCTRQNVGNVIWFRAPGNHCAILVQGDGNVGLQNRYQCHSLKAFSSLAQLSQHRTGTKTRWISTNLSKNRSAAEDGAQETMRQQQQQRPLAGTTIDKEEVSKFSSLAELWWDEAGEFEALHSMNELRVPLIRDALLAQRRLLETGDGDGGDGGGVPTPARPLEGMRILDVGSGGGILSEPLARLGASVVGVDASEENIKIAQAHVQHEGGVARRVKYIQATVEDLLPTETGRFDAVVASEVVEHVADVSTFLTACCQLVKPGGSIFLTTLNKTYLSYAVGVVGAENLLRLVSPGTHDWNKFIPPQDLQYILDQNGFSTRLLHGMLYNPLTKRWSWMKNTSVNYAIHAVRAAPANPAHPTDPAHTANPADPAREGSADPQHHS